jgi:hypothetical protein
MRRYLKKFKEKERRYYQNIKYRLKLARLYEQKALKKLSQVAFGKTVS